MGCEVAKLKDNSKLPSEYSRKTLEALELEQIIEKSYDSIFVIDKFGNVLLANQATAKLMGLEAEDLIGKNVKDLVQGGIYDWSPSLTAAETRSVVTGLVKTKRTSFELMSTSTPLIDDSGDVVMVITNTRDQNLIDKYISAIEEERSKAERYKTAVEYLSEVDLEQNTVVAESASMHQILTTSKLIAKTDGTVMLLGESGTGKEVMAKYIHRNSRQAKEPFIPVNCAAIPSELLESEFFGYAPGAFTGASSRGKPGLFEIAHKGTLFLDEIGELPLAMQSKLLRVLENGEIKRVGSTTITKTNVRLVAATNRDLQAMIDQNLFRSDLYYRLNVIPINIPPLRERPEDILVLARRFLTEFNKKYGLKKTFTPQALQAFIKYSWPGNVRELRNVIERLVITSTDDNLSFEDDSFVCSKINSKTKESLSGKKVINKGTLKSYLKALEEEYINEVLAESAGRVSEAAERLGIHRSRLYRKLEKIKIK